MSDAEGPKKAAPKGGGAGGEPSPSRRGALGALVVVGSAAYAGALAVPGYRFLAGQSGTAAGGERWIRVAQLSALTEGKLERITVLGDARDAFTVTKAMKLGSVWLRRSGDAVTAMSAECPHLGCAVDIGADKQSFACPCHTSKFALDGKAEAGPSPRGMDALGTRIVDGWVEVDFRRFRQGVADKVEV